MKVYIAATGKDDGKTVLSIGLLHALRKNSGRIGYIKPVGQEYLVVDGKKIDKDVVLVSRIYDLKDDLSDLSPIAIPRGFTSAYIRRPRKEELQNRILGAFERASRDKEAMIIEGTGHAGVGSVFDLSNAAVAGMLKSKVILVALGGVGRPIDEILLNKAMFDQMGVEIIGVIINKVRRENYEKIDSLVRRSLSGRGLEVLGVVPFDPVLSAPTISEIMTEIKGKLLWGEDSIYEEAGRYVVGAMPISTALDYFRGRFVLITPGNREDLILAALTQTLTGDPEHCRLTGIILTGGILPHRNVIEVIKKTDYPLILVEDDTYTVTSRVHSLNFKIKAEDHEKIAETQTLISRHVDIDRLRKLCGE